MGRVAPRAKGSRQQRGVRGDAAADRVNGSDERDDKAPRRIAGGLVQGVSSRKPYPRTVTTKLLVGSASVKRPRRRRTTASTASSVNPPASSPGHTRATISSDARAAADR